MQSVIEAEVATVILQLNKGQEQITIVEETLTLTKEALHQIIERQKLGAAKYTLTAD